MLTLCHHLCIQVPRVFINGNCIGGGSDTKQLHQQGKLVPLIEQCAPCCAASSAEGSGSGQFESAKWLTVFIVLFNPVFIKCSLDLLLQVGHCLSSVMLYIYQSALDTWCLSHLRFHPGMYSVTIKVTILERKKQLWIVELLQKLLFCMVVSFTMTQS